MPSDPPPPEAKEEEKPKSAAVRAYLQATIMPALLKGLVELDKEECASCSGKIKTLPIIYARHLTCAHLTDFLLRRGPDAGANDPLSGWRST